MEALKLIGFLLPPAIDLINRKVSDTDWRFWISVIVCVIVGIIICAIEGSLGNINNVVTTILAIIGEAQITYKGAYGDSGIQDAIRG